MKNFKNLLGDAYVLASTKKHQRQTIVLAFVLLGLFLYLVWSPIWSSKISNLLAEIEIYNFPILVLAVLVVLLCITVVIYLVAFLFSSLPIGRIRIKNIRKFFLLLYREELSRLEEDKSDVKKNIKLLVEKQISTGKLLDGKLHNLEMLLDYQKTLDETSEGIKAGRYMSLKEPLDLAYICMFGLSFLDSESELQAAINQRSKMLDLIKSELKEEEDRLIRTNDELQLFYQEVGSYARPTEVSPDVTSYIR